MRVKIPPSEVLKQEIFGLLEAGLETASHPLELFVNLAARLMLQIGLEKEVMEFLGRAYYQRHTRSREGWRNGYEPKKLKTSSGILPMLIPQIRDSREPFKSRLLEVLGNSGKALQDMVTRMYVRGLSTRDIEGLFQEVFGEGIISRSGVSQLSQTLLEEFDKWRKRDLSALKVVYLFLDAAYLPVRQGD